MEEANPTQLNPEPTAPRVSRAKSTVVVAFAAVIGAFLGYVILLEWHQHVYPTQLGRGQTANPNTTAAGRASVDQFNKQKCLDDVSFYISETCDKFRSEIPLTPETVRELVHKIRWKESPTHGNHFNRRLILSTGA
jgi:hypothetical protein